MARLQDVADLAGVSIATASRALAPGHAMRASTRQRVLKATAKLGYQPRQRSRQESAVVAVLSAGAAHRSISPIIDQITATGATCSMLATSRSTEVEADLTERLVREPGLRGVIIVGAITPDDRWRERMERSVRRLSSRGIPLVFCGRGGGTLGVHDVSSVDYDQPGGMRTAIDHLVRQGHRTIGLVHGPPGLTISDSCRRGFAAGITAHRLELGPDLQTAAPAVDSAAAATRILLARRPDITALVCTSDVIAIGAMNGAAQLDLRIPDDVSLIGFDDMFGVDRLTPPLTTVRAPWQSLALRTVAHAFAGLDRPKVELLGTELVIRDTVLDRRYPTRG